MLGARLLDSFWETAMFCNMCGITSYFPWQQNGQYFKQTGGEKILGIVSDDFWILLKIFFFGVGSGQCKEKGDDEWQIMVKYIYKNNNQTPHPLISACMLFHENLQTALKSVFWWNRWDNLGCCLTEHWSSGILCFCYPAENITNTHVIRCPLLGQHRTTTSVLHWARASLINSAVK